MQQKVGVKQLAATLLTTLAASVSRPPAFSQHWRLPAERQRGGGGGIGGEGLPTVCPPPVQEGGGAREMERNDTEQLENV